MAKKNLSFVGLADIYMKKYDAAAPARYVGSVSACNIQHEEENLRQRNFGREGGTLNTVSRLDQVNVGITFQSLSIENLARVLRGGVTDVAADSVTEEARTAYLGALVRTEHMNIENVVVTDDTSTTTFVEGTDYRVTGAGIVILEAGSITEAQAILVSYDYTAQQVVEAFTEGQQEYGLYFDGINEADNNRNVVVDIHRLKLGLPEQLDLIGEGFITMATTGEALLDSNQVGAGTSKFYRWIYPSAAA